MSENQGFMLQDGKSQGPFSLAGPVDKPDPLRTPLRGDLAHICLAGRYFVPHYAVPMPRTAGKGGARLRAEPADAAELVLELVPGQPFDLLDTTGDWAWGCLGPQGPVGYVRSSELQDPSA